MFKNYTAVCLLATALTVAPAVMVPAFAQNAAPPPSSSNNSNSGGQAAASASDRSYITSEAADTWRASKMIGLDVYNEQNQKVGDINELLFGKDGRVAGVVIGVGGFLGIGERNVAVRYDELRWSMQSASATARTTDGPATGVGSTVTNPSGAIMPTTNTATDSSPSGTSTATTGLGNTPSNPSGALFPAAPSGTAGTATTGNARVATTDAAKPPAYPDHAILPNASQQQLQNAPQFEYGGAPR